MEPRTDGHIVLSEHEQLVSLLEQHIDLTQQIRDLTLQSMAQMLSALTALNDKLAAQATPGERVSSAEVKTSARGVDVTTKAYVGSDLPPAVDAAVAEYFRAQTLVDEGLALKGATRG